MSSIYPSLPFSLPDCISLPVLCGSFQRADILSFQGNASSIICSFCSPAKSLLSVPQLSTDLQVSFFSLERSTSWCPCSCSNTLLSHHRKYDSLTRRIGHRTRNMQPALRAFALALSLSLIFSYTVPILSGSQMYRYVSFQCGCDECIKCQSAFPDVLMWGHH